MPEGNALDPVPGYGAYLAHMGTFTIGRLAQAAGVNVETVRYYERRGLLEQPPRAGSGYRQYTDSDLWRLQFIARGKRLGFTLAEIAELMGAAGTRSTEEILRAARSKIEALDERQRQLAQTRSRLEELADLCEKGADADCIALRVVTAGTPPAPEAASPSPGPPPSA